jgi:ABC-type polysaccharide/polyol phosphate export permease
MERSAGKPATPVTPGPEGVFLGRKMTATELELGIPKVAPRSAGELDAIAPPKQRYPVPLMRSLRELTHARELLLTFVERDLRVRYKQAVLGGLWAIIQPLMLVVIFTLLFGRIARIPVGAPYPIFAYTALSAWGFFSGAITYATNGVIMNAGVVRKIYFPREVIPLSAVLSSAFDFAMSVPILVVMLLAYQRWPQVTWVAYPLLFGILAMFALAAALIVAAVTVYYRDTRYGVPTVMQLVLFATPIAYPLARAMKALPTISAAYPYLNPLAPLMDGFRRVLLFGQWPDWGPTISAGVVATVFLAGAYVWFKRVDPTFADVI